MSFYILWACIYSLINFVLASETIKKKRYMSLFIQMTTTPSAILRFLAKYKIIPTPLVFMFFHFLLWFTTAILALVCYTSFYLNTILMCYYLYCCLWNGSCYYMDYFARKYEMQLAQLEKMEKGVNQVENTTESKSEKDKATGEASPMKTTKT